MMINSLLFPTVSRVAAAALVVAVVALPDAALAQALAPGQMIAPSDLTPPSDTNKWAPSEVTRELARCAQLFRGLDIVAKPLDPVKDHECGTPAPVELISVGRSPQVSFSPPVTVTCDLAAAMHRWVKGDLQPLARRHLGSEIIRIDTMSSYSCRTAYGRKHTRLSEHGRANAIDIRAFMTAKGGASEVLADWGLTGREIAAQVAAAKKNEAVNPVARAPMAVPASPAATATASAARQPNAPSVVSTGSIAAPPVGIALVRPSISIGDRDGGSIGLGLPGAHDSALGLATGIGSPSRLGGPKANEASPMLATGKTDFLRGAHASACRIFGTVLGPEANTAHRNHFHVDMADRKLKAICE